MKAQVSYAAIAALGIALSAAVSAHGTEGDKGAAKAAPVRKATAAKAGNVERTMITGSRIPRTSKSEHYSTATELSVSVINRKQLDQLGAGSLNQALKKAPMFR